MYNLRNRRAGFTALEILIVLLIISIFSTFAILSYSSYRRQARIKQAALAVESTFSTARTLAINHNANFEVAIDIDNGHFWINKLDRRGRIVQPKVTGANWLPEEVLFSEVRKNNYSYYSGTVPILFRANSSSEYTTIYLLGENSDGSVSGNYYSIRVYPSTGLSHTYKNQRK